MSLPYPFRHIRKYGNNTNNRIESFFHALKAAVHILRRTAPSISEYIGILYRFCCDKFQSSTYASFLNQTTNACSSAGKYPDIFLALGKLFSDYALRALRVQLQLFIEATYLIKNWPDGSYTVENTVTQVTRVL